MTGHADGRGVDAIFGNWRVEHPGAAIFALQMLRGPEHAAEIAYILAHRDHPNIARHDHIMSIVDRLDNVHRGHGAAPTPSASVFCSLSCQGRSRTTSSTIDPTPPSGTDCTMPVPIGRAA